MLKSKKCENFDDLRVISRDTYTDSRGEFYKIFNLDDLKKFGWIEWGKKDGPALLGPKNMVVAD